jgi:peptide/histidine transporter 3/4
MHFGVPTAANTVTTWAGTTCLTPLLGGFIADTYLGRYLTLLFLGFVELLVHYFHPPCVCPVSYTSLHTIRTRSSSLIDKSSPIAET